MSFRYFYAMFTATLLGSIACAAEPAAIPDKFSAVIGGFFGSTYGVALRDGTLYYTERKARTGPADATSSATIKPTAEQWREFRQSIDELKAWRWRPDYSDSAIMDGTQWQLELAYSDHSLKTGGSNKYPEHFDRYLAAVQKLLGGKTFK